VCGAAARAAAQGGMIPFVEMCRRFGVTPRTGRKWRRRFAEEGRAGLFDRSRRPHRQPALVAPEVEGLVCEAAAVHPAWGAAKIRRWLQDRGKTMPATSTVHRILCRHGIRPRQVSVPSARQRFEMAGPNVIWQMDFKGHLPLTRGGRCHPLTVLDDHSRFNLLLASCADERGQTVQGELTRVFRRYGLPERMLMDNGSPWGAADDGLTRIESWLIRLGVRVLHGRPYHPQTQGKEERFHRTLKIEVLEQRPAWPDLVTVQRAFDAWRQIYNFERPHAALDLATPASRYVSSLVPLPAMLPPIEYAPDDTVRMITDHGQVRFHGRRFLVGRGLRGEPVALRTAGDGVWDVYYCRQRVAQIDLASGLNEGNDVSER
jgi:transposase InsO family protein